MATDPSRVVVPGVAHLYRANVGATMPTGLETPAAPEWTELGFTSEDGTQLSTDPGYEQIYAHQSAYPVRTIKTRDRARLAFEMQEWSAVNLSLAFGGGEVTEVDPTGTPGVYRYDPPAATTMTPGALIVDAIDGAVTYRVVIPSAIPSEGVEIPLAKTGASLLGITLDAQASGAAPPWYMLTDATAFAPAA